MLELTTRQRTNHHVIPSETGMCCDESGSHTLHGWQVLLLWQPRAAVAGGLGGLGSGAVRVEDEGVEGGRDGAVLPQAEHVLARMEVLVVQHQQRLCMHPAPSPQLAPALMRTRLWRFST